MPQIARRGLSETVSTPVKAQISRYYWSQGSSTIYRPAFWVNVAQLLWLEQSSRQLPRRHLILLKAPTSIGTSRLSLNIGGINIERLNWFHSLTFSKSPFRSIITAGEAAVTVDNFERFVARIFLSFFPNIALLRRGAHKFTGSLCELQTWNNWETF